MRDFWILVAYFMVALRRALMVAWIRINKFFCNSDWQVPRTSGFRHKVRCSRVLEKPLHETK